MWHKLKNIFFSFKTYGVLSPDLQARRQVNCILRDRPALTFNAWFESYCRPYGITQPIASFTYIYLERYSGLQFARVIPSDRLHEDLRWTQICWFDWELTLCEDFWRCFEIDISDRLNESALSTIGELLTFLNHQLLSISPSCKDS